MTKIVSGLIATMIVSIAAMSVSLAAQTTTTVAAMTATTVAPYDQAATKATMHQFIGLIGKIKPAIASGDFYAAADGFYSFAKLGEKLALTAPPKGSAADWAKTWDSFISTALTGVGAAGEKDAAKEQKALDSLLAIHNTGHSLFR